MCLSCVMGSEDPASKQARQLGPCVAPIYPNTLFCSTRYQRVNSVPFLVTMRLLAPFSLTISLSVLYPFVQDGSGMQDMNPSAPTLICRSTRNQRGNCPPILANVRLNCFLQRVVFICCPATLASTPGVGNQNTMPSSPTLSSCSTWNQCGNCSPIRAIVPLYCTLQLAVFVCFPNDWKGKGVFAALVIQIKLSFSICLHAVVDASLRRNCSRARTTKHPSR
jgi:hypothetical protein